MSFDALVHFKISTEQLYRRTVEQLAGCLAKQTKLSSQGEVQQHAMPVGRVIGASVSESHTSELNCDFSYIYYLAYIVPYILDAVI